MPNRPRVVAMAQEPELPGIPPAPSPSETHPLLEPRLLAAFGVAGLGLGVGIGLMYAHILIVTGLIISLASALGVFSIYFQHYRAAGLALSGGAKYQGASVIELLIATLMIVAIIPISVIVFSYSSQKEFNPNRAHIEFLRAYPESYLSQTEWNFNVEIKNIGNVEALRILTRVIGIIPDHVLSKEEEEHWLDIVRARLRVTSKENYTQISQGQYQTITLPDLAVKARDLADIAAARKELWIFLVSNYEDEANDEGYWVFEFCGHYNYTWDYWHNCKNPTRTVRAANRP
jgi:hypothetical protein